MCGKFASSLDRFLSRAARKSLPARNFFPSRPCLFGGFFFCAIFLVLFGAFYTIANGAGRMKNDDGNFIYLNFFVSGIFLSMEHLMRCKWSAYRSLLAFSRWFFSPPDLTRRWLCLLSQNVLSVNWFMARQCCECFKNQLQAVYCVTCNGTI